MLKVIHGTEPREKINYALIHLRGLISALDNYEQKQQFETLKKVCYHGVKYGCMLDRRNKDDYSENTYHLLGGIINCLSKLTPRQFMQLFPIRKEYDGEKWEVKDYYSTLEAVGEYDVDKCIGNGINDFMWDYCNLDIFGLNAAYLAAMDELHKQEYGIGAMEEFLREQGVATYRMGTTPTGAKVLIDDNGKITKIRRHHRLKIVGKEGV